jgi:hypothetical protein
MSWRNPCWVCSWKLANARLDSGTIQRLPAPATLKTRWVMVAPAGSGAPVSSPRYHHPPRTAIVPLACSTSTVALVAARASLVTGRWQVPGRW